MKTSSKIISVYNGIREYFIRSQQCLRLKSSMLFKRDLGLKNIPLSKQPFTMQPKLNMKTTLVVLNII